LADAQVERRVGVFDQKGADLVGITVKKGPGRLQRWRERRRSRRERRRFAAGRLTDATRQNKGDAERWAGPSS
jgi:hypothetical protein